MERVAGVRRNSYRYLYAGFSYNRVGDSNYYRCSHRGGIFAGCPGRVKVDATGDVIVVRAHAHMANAAEGERIAMQAEMRRRARETHVEPRKIFDAVSIDPRFATAAVGVSYESMRTSLFRERANTRPRVPRTLEALGIILEEYDATRMIYHGMIQTTMGDVAIIMAGQEMITALNLAIEVHVDVTFRVVPNSLRACHMLTIHIHMMDMEFPAAFVLYEKRTLELYCKIWKRLIELCPRMPTSLTAVVSDFDEDLFASVQQTFPRTRVRGCWSHFCQAVLRQWKKIGNPRAPKTILWMSLGIPLMPAERLTTGFDVIANAADKIAPKFPFVLQFVQYMRRQWVPFAEFLSVRDFPIRTYNVAKSFDEHIVAKLSGGRTNIWAFLDELKGLIRVEALNLARVTNGYAVRRRDESAQRQEDARIMEAQARLDSGRYDVHDFLTTLIRPSRRQIVQNYEENETVDRLRVTDDEEGSEVKISELSDNEDRSFALVGRMSDIGVDGAQELQTVRTDGTTIAANQHDLQELEIIEIIEEIEITLNPGDSRDATEEMDVPQS